MDGLEAAKRIRNIEESDRILANKQKDENLHFNVLVNEYLDISEDSSLMKDISGSPNNEDSSTSAVDEKSSITPDIDTVKTLSVKWSIENLLLNSVNDNDLNNKNSAIPCRNRLPIIGMSANSDDATKKEALAMGMDFFIPKPFNMDKFLELLNLLKG